MAVLLRKIIRVVMYGKVDRSRYTYVSQGAHKACFCSCRLLSR